MESIEMNIENFPDIVMQGHNQSFEEEEKGQTEFL